MQVDPNTADSKQVMLYQLLLELLRMEDVCRQRVRESEEEVSCRSRPLEHIYFYFYLYLYLYL